MLSAPVQLIAWKDHPRNVLLCVEGDVKQLLTQLLKPVLINNVATRLSC